MSERWNKTVRLFDAEQYDDDFPTDNLVNFAAWLGTLISEVPEKFRTEATIEINSNVYYDSPMANIEISYTRPETDEEMSERLSMDRARILMRENKERTVLAALQNKYGVNK